MANVILPGQNIITDDHGINRDVQALVNAVLSMAAGAAASVAGAGSVATDASAAGIVDVTATGSFTLANPTNSTNGQKVLWRIWNNTGSAITVTLGSNFKFGNAVASLPQVSAGAVMYLASVYRTLGGVTKWDIVAVDGF